MYRKRGSSPNLQQVLNKMNGKKRANYTPVDYNASDVKAARAVLDRLLSPTSTRREVLSITEVPEENNE